MSARSRHAARRRSTSGTDRTAAGRRDVGQRPDPRFALLFLRRRHVTVVVVFVRAGSQRAGASTERRRSLLLAASEQVDERIAGVVERTGGTAVGSRRR